MLTKKRTLSLSIFLFVLIVSIISINTSLFAAETLSILKFEASNTKVVLGEAFILSWEVTGSNSIEISGPDKLPDMVFPEKYELELWPSKTTTYTLTAYSASGQKVSKSIVVEVLDNSNTVAIDSFTASKYSISAGDSVILSWETRNEDSIALLDGANNEIKVSEGLSEVVVSPTITTTYTLKAITNELVEYSTVTILVNSPTSTANIVQFYADRTTITKDGIAYLNWKVENAKKVVLNYIAKDYFVTVNSSSGSVMVAPDETTTYELVAVGTDGKEVKKTITITVIGDQAEIIKFSADKTSVAIGETVTLSWELKNAQELSISDDKGKILDLSAGTGILKSGKITVNPTTTTKYYLTTAGSNGLKVTSILTITVNSSVAEIKIVKFQASSYNVQKGELVELSWEIKNATGCFILTSDGSRLMQMPTTGSVYITPNVTRSYTLIAYGSQTKAVDSTITINVI